MRICSPTCGVRNDSNSGGEVLERETVRALPAAGILPHVLVRPAPWAWTLAPQIGRCGSLIRAHSARWLGPACLRARRATGCPVVIHWQHIDRSCWNLLERWVLMRADLIVTISEFSKRQLVEDWHLLPTHIHVVQPGVGPEFFPADRLAVRPRILYLGGLKPRKNVGLLLEALPQVLAVVPEAELLLAGHGPDRDALMRRAHALNLDDHIIWVSHFSDRDRPWFYRTSRVFAFPSLLEGCGMPVLEARASGLPIVASNRGALPELVPDAVEPTPEMFAERLIAHLRHPTPAAPFKRSWDEMGRELATLYRTLCA